MRTLLSGLSISTALARATALLVALAAMLTATTLQADQAAPLVVGSTITISVSSDGTQPFAYQWKKNGVDIAGAIDAQYVIDSATVDDVGVYTALVTNDQGSTLSDAATLTLAVVAPSFSLEPAGQVADVDSTVTFTAEAVGTAPITYQWRKTGVNISNGPLITGATSTALTLSHVTTASAGTYTVVATNAAGSVVSTGAILFIVTPPSSNQAPVFTVNPIPRDAFRNETVTFTAIATALPEATYQWLKNGVPLANTTKIAGVNSTTLTIANVAGFDTGSYSLRATNSIGSTTSTAAALKVTTNEPPIITAQPGNQTATTGGTAFFTVALTGYPVPALQWRKDGQTLTNSGHYSGVNTKTLTVSNVSSADIGTYSVFASNVVGTATSDGATLAVNGAPAILSQPSSLSIVTAGTVVNLAVTVGGDPAPTVQWRRNGTNLANGGAVSGATTSTLTLTNVGNANSGKYSVVVTNSQGTVTSSDFEVVVLAGNVSNQPATAGKDVALSAPEASGNLQWQISNDFGTTWINLVNGGAYSGVTTNTLNIAGVTPALNNSLFRLITSGTTTVLHSTRLSVIEAFLPFPVSVSSDASGNLYVADASSDTIGKINASTQITVHAGTAGQTGTTDGTGTAARFNDPSGVASTSDGTLVVADKANATIRLVSPTGIVTTLAGSTTLRGNVDGTGSSATFSAPLGVTRDSAGSYYVADSMNHTIRKVTADGVVTTLAGTAGQAGSADGNGTAARFNNPSGIDVDSGGTVYVADTTNNTIRKITSTGTVTTLAGLAGVSGISDGAGALALFNQPTGLAVDNAGNIYVADTASSTVRKITSSGVVSTIAGLPGIAGHKDGSGLGAWFNQPRDVSIGSGGLLYVADTGNASIRRIDQNGTVTTLALTAQPSSNVTPNQPFPETPTLPSTPSLPSIPSTPTLPTSPTLPSAPSSGGGGGGAPSLWFYGALVALALLRRSLVRQR